jgi:hypothetical protein
MTGKYTPLEKYLKALTGNKQDVTLSFEQIERILNDKLPASAHRHQAWWANEKEGSHVHAHSWLNAGWKVDSVNQKGKWVRLIRLKGIINK